jgi:UDP-N-acetylglucosamine 2-epimerase (non-hydrolysing)
VSRRRWVVVAVVGARPNIMKTAPVLGELARRDERFQSLLVHTGQHYDTEMSSVFLEQLKVQPPDFVLGVGSGTHGEQTARVIERIEPILRDVQPDLLLVPGDVNSTLAAALAAVKLQIPVAHLEAGLRSFDRTMPEEINRLVTDAVSDLHLIHSPEARANLLREGIPADRIHDVGNTMIDTLLQLLPRPEVSEAPRRIGIPHDDYLLVTLHRPSLVDGPLLDAAMAQLVALSRELPIVFPVHPRTRAALGGRFDGNTDDLLLLPPLGYLEFLGLMARATAVLTDSGGVQEETTVLGVPCFTLRARTERPVTVECGTNTILGLDPARIADIPRLLEEAKARPARVPPLWDGRAAERTVDALEAFLAARTQA